MPVVNELELKPSEFKELFQLHVGARAERRHALSHDHCVLVWSKAKNVTILQKVKEDSYGPDFLLANLGHKSHAH